MLFQEEQRIGREINCVRTGESWYMADDGRGGVERELRLRWLRVCRGVLRPPAVHPSSCWTQAWGGQEYPCPVSRFSGSLDERSGEQVDCDSHQLVSGEMQGSLLPFPAQKQFFMLFLPVVLLKLKMQTHLQLCGTIEEDVKDLKDVHDVSREKVPAHVLFCFSNVLTCCVNCHLCWWGFGLSRSQNYASCLQVAYNYPSCLQGYFVFLSCKSPFKSLNGFPGAAIKSTPNLVA